MKDVTCSETHDHMHLEVDIETEEKNDVRYI